MNLRILGGLSKACSGLEILTSLYDLGCWSGGTIGWKRLGGLRGLGGREGLGGIEGLGGMGGIGGMEGLGSMGGLGEIVRDLISGGGRWRSGNISGFSGSYPSSTAPWPTSPGKFTGSVLLLASARTTISEGRS